MMWNKISNVKLMIDFYCVLPLLQALFDHLVSIVLKKSKKKKTFAKIKTTIKILLFNFTIFNVQMGGKILFKWMDDAPKFVQQKISRKFEKKLKFMQKINEAQKWD